MFHIKNNIFVLNVWFPGLVLPSSIDLFALLFQMILQFSFVSVKEGVFLCKCEGRNAYLSELSYLWIFFEHSKIWKGCGLCSQRKLQNGLALTSFTCVCVCARACVRVCVRARARAPACLSVSVCLSSHVSVFKNSRNSEQNVMEFDGWDRWALNLGMTHVLWI
jgi:hypothetical protein